MKASVNTPSRRPSKVMCVFLMSVLLMAGVTGQSISPTIMTSDPPTPAPVATDPPSPAPVATATPVTDVPSGMPTAAPVAVAPTEPPTGAPSGMPTAAPVAVAPTEPPTGVPSGMPTAAPVAVAPTEPPTNVPSGMPTAAPVAVAPTDPPTMPTTTASPSAIPSASNPPSVMPTSSPSFVPSLSAAPSKATMGAPTQTPSAGPSETVTTDPTSSPSRALVEESINGLEMTLNGISELPSSVYGDFASSMELYYADLTGVGVDGPSFVTVVVVVQSASPLDGRKQLRRQLQSSVVVTYEQGFTYIPTRDDVTAAFLATEPFATLDGRNTFLQLLQEANPTAFAAVTSTSEVALPVADSPSVAPSAAPDDGDDDGLSAGAIVGIAIGGAAVFGIILYFLMAGRNTGDNYQASTAENPPNVLKVSVAGDEVSTLDGPAGNAAPASGESLAGYGDQSVATVDYDYSKAYGGGGDTSVSSAGGTFGSNVQGISALDPANAAATGATLGGAGSFSDTDSFEAHYRDPNANVKEELIEIFAPPGKLGVVIDTPDDGAPVVHAVKDSSAIANKIKVGDKLVAVDDEDVRSMTAIKVSKLISRKNANPSRKLSIIRTTVVG